MADENIRITAQEELNTLTQPTYVLTDNPSDGTHKYDLNKLALKTEMTEAIAAETSARETSEAALEADVTDLKEDLTYLYDGYEIINFDIIENSYPATDGTFPTYSNWNRSDYIPVTSSDVIHVKNTGRATSDNAWYDSEKSIIRRFSIAIGDDVVLTPPDNAAYMVISNQASTFFDAAYKIVTGLATKDDVDEIRSELSHVDPVKINCTLENGTIGNASNPNAVRTANYIPCKYGDLVTFYPVRPNATGCSYLYGYKIYDANGNSLANVTDAIATGNVVEIAYNNAATIRFFWVESDGTNLQPLRANTYGYIPYAIAEDGSTLSEKVESLEKAAELVAVGNVLSASSWTQGGINQGVENSVANRIRTGYIEVGYSSSYTINVYDNYKFAVSFYDINKNFITSTPAWVGTNTTYDNDGTTAYIRLVLAKSGDVNINPTDYNHISCVFTRPSQYAQEYIDKKVSNASLEKARYTDLLSQARFSPNPSPDSPHTANVLTLLHFSDVHGDLTAMKKALEIYASYSEKIDDVIHTGDVVVANWSDGIVNWVNSGCAESVISVIGNHDSENNLILGTAGKENVYNGMLAPYISNWDVVQPTGVDDSSSPYYCSCFYYKDYDDVSMRLIVLDTNWWDSYQKSWLGDVLDDALTNEYAVILACHTPRYVTGVTESHFCSYTEPNISESSSYTNITSDWLDPVDDFIENGGEVVCMLTGHNHRDHFGYLTNYPNVLCLTADKASVRRTIDTARIEGELNATAFNAVTFNTTDKWIKIVRFGAEVDGQMRGKHVFCYDYANKRIISQW